MSGLFLPRQSPTVTTASEPEVQPAASAQEPTRHEPCLADVSAPAIIPESSLPEWGIALAIGILSCLYLLAFRRVTTLNPDEGLSLQGAQRILAGQIPHRDFFSLVTPGTYYWTALLFRVFGDSILVARTALVVYGGVFSLLLYLLARRVCSRRNAVLGAFLLAITCLPNYFVFEHNWDSTLWTCLAIYCAVRFLEHPHWTWAFSVGMLSSLTCLFEQSKGGGLVLGLAVGFALISFKFGGRALFTRRHVAAVALGLAVPLLVTVIYFGAKHALAPMLADWLWPLKHYNSVNRVPYGFMALSASERSTLNSGSLAWRLFAAFTLSPCFLVPVLPILGLVVLGRRLLKVLKYRARDHGQAHYVLVCSCMGGLWLSLLVARPEFNHVMYLAPIFYLVLCWIFEGKAFGGSFMPASRRVLTAYLVLSFSSLGLAILANAWTAHQPLVSRRGTLMVAEPDAVTSYLQRHVPMGGTMFMYPYQPLYYYLTGAINPTSYDFLYQGYHTPSQFHQAMCQLEADPPPVALFCPSFAMIEVIAIPGTPLRTLARPDPMVEFMFSHYRGCRSLRSAAGFSYVFMVRRDLMCPKDSIAR